MRRAAQVGLHPRDAMRLTLRELVLYTQGVNDARREQWRQQIAHAHLVASLSRVPRNKRLPPLSSLLPRDEIKTSVADRRKRFWDAVKTMAKPGELQTAKKAKKKK